MSYAWAKQVRTLGKAASARALQICSLVHAILIDCVTKVGTTYTFIAEK